MVINLPRGARVKSRSGIYHIMLRGVNKQEIFHDDEDCITFLDTINRYKEKAELAVYAWCLMNNHVHLLLKEGNEDISITMKRIGVSFVSYYNRKYETTGHLFQDRFRSENVESMRYLLTVTRYIHQNPVKAGMVQQVDLWKWSSCLGYYRKTVYPRRLLDSDDLLSLFSSDLSIAQERFKQFNERKNNDECLEVQINQRRLSDNEARQEIKTHLSGIELAQVKSLPREKRNKVLKQVKEIDGISQRQAARILGVSPSLVFKA